MTPYDLREAICREIAKIWPDRFIYRDVCPDDHQRPSSYVQVLESTPIRVNPSLLRWDAKLLITLWGKPDGYGLADGDGLAEDQHKVLFALIPPLPAGDRMVLADASDAGQDPADGAAFIEVKATWYNSANLNTEIWEGENCPPPMKDFHARLEYEKGVERNG